MFELERLKMELSLFILTMFVLSMMIFEHAWTSLVIAWGFKSKVLKIYNFFTLRLTMLHN